MANNPSTLFSVAGKNVLITGGSRGIGLMIAKGFVQAGANVLLTSRSEQACQEAAEKLQCQYVASNVSTREGCEALASHVQKVFDNKLHCLINNAGTSWGEPLERKQSKNNWGWDKVMDLNVKGLFFLTNACLPMLQATATPEDPSRIVNIGSVAGLIHQEAPTHAYDVSKAAVHHLTRKFSADFAKDNITVNAVAPGFVPSRMSAGLATWGGSSEKLAASIPLQRLGQADDMAGACIYFCSRAGAWVTGTILPVDGGSVGALQLPLSSL
jgi:NAD(P)-dependent dehydrogenase (short-subunit alcohol dehydrogenase family)